MSNESKNEWVEYPGTDMVDPDELSPAEYNPRHWSEEARTELRKSLKEFGFTTPIVVNKAENREGVIIGGNFRHSIAKELDMDKIPVTYVEIPDIKREKELNLRLNKNQGEFDFDMLSEFEEGVLEEVGFDDEELDDIFQEEHETDDDFDVEEEVEEIDEPNASTGDIYKLGPHRLMCGDAADRDDVKELMGGDKAEMVFTDPPYNVNYSGQGENTSTTITNDDQPEEKFRELLNDWFQNYDEFLKESGPLYTCYASSTHPEFEDALNNAGFTVKNQIVWVKKPASMGWGDYRWKHEPIFYAAREGKATNYYGDRKQYTTWEEKLSDEELLKKVKRIIKKDERGGSTVWRLHRDSNYEHPTQKPIQLCTIPIRNSSTRDDIVMDLFGGSGSTLIAAEKMNRACYMMELEPEYVDVIISRWEDFTGQQAELID